MDTAPLDGREEGDSCPIVAIGASAGGIQALQQFFGAVPEDPGMAFIVVLHLSPSHESHLVNVLQRTTGLDVIQVQTTARVRPNCIYVIAPNSVLTIGDHRIRTRAPKTDAERRHPVDAIFSSLAENRNARAMCVVLSGSGSNGSAGAQAVRERDGLVLVQEPETAEHAQMPRNVILAGLADAVLPPDRMPEVLRGYALEFPAVVADVEGDDPEATEPAISSILSVLRTRGQHDFGPYRKRTLARRIARRMGLARISDMARYAEKLRNEPDEVKALIGDLLINVTGFFRDPEGWETLRKSAIAPIVGGREDGQPVRAWVPACSTGEEAYTLAMLLLEARDEAEKGFEVKVFATDAAPQALARARAGLFPETIAEAIPPARLTRYFEKEDDLYRAKKDLREAVIFAPQNLLADPPFSRLDLVTCRNLLIYLEPQVQEKVIALLHFSLREGGFLFLGSAETVGRHSGLFQPISKKWRIYRRIGTTRHELIDFPLLGTEHQALRDAGRDGSLRRAPADDARDAMLATFAPPSVLVDEHSQILYFHGEVDRYLTMPRGEAKLDLLSMAREELRPRLRAALRQAGKEAARIVAEFGGRPGRRERVRIVVSPVSHRSSPRGFSSASNRCSPCRRPRGRAGSPIGNPCRTDTSRRSCARRARSCACRSSSWRPRTRS